MLHKEKIEKEINEVRERTNQRVRQFIQLSFEKEAEKRVTQLKEEIENNQVRPSTSYPSSSSKQKVDDGIYITSCNVSVGTKIKCEALLHHEKYHSLDVQGKAIVSLGLNSISDLSFNSPLAQTSLFNRQQWKQLRNRFPLKKYNVSDYNHLLESMISIDFIYNEKKGHDVNWLNLYKELKKTGQQV